jgi:hypothetical protein
MRWRGGIAAPALMLEQLERPLSAGREEAAVGASLPAFE